MVGNDLKGPVLRQAGGQRIPPNAHEGEGNVVDGRDAVGRGPRQIRKTSREEVGQGGVDQPVHDPGHKTDDPQEGDLGATAKDKAEGFTDRGHFLLLLGLLPVGSGGGSGAGVRCPGHLARDGLTSFA